MIIGGVEHASIFALIFQGVKHGVGERVSLRGAVFIGVPCSPDFVPVISNYRSLTP